MDHERGIVMKIFSIASMTVLLLGAGAVMQSAPARAALPISNCYKLAMECNQGNQRACQIYAVGCKEEAPTGSIVGNTPPTKSDHRPDAALLRSK